MKGIGFIDKIKKYAYNTIATFSIFLIVFGFIAGFNIFNLSDHGNFKLKLCTYYFGFVLLSLALLISYIFLRKSERAREKWKLQSGILFLLYGISVLHPLTYKYRSGFLIILLFLLMERGNTNERSNSIFALFLKYRITCLIRLGDTYYRGGQPEKAKKKYKKAALLNPEYSFPYYKLGLLYSENNDLEEAMENFKKACSLKPEKAESHLCLASIYGRMFRNDLAKEEYEKSIALNKKCAGAYFGLAYIHSVQGNLPKSKESLKKAIEIDPKYSKTAEKFGMGQEADDR